MDKATKIKGSGSSRPRESGEFGDSGEEKIAQELRADHGATDQIGRLWLGVKKGSTVGYIAVDALVGGNMVEISAVLRKQGLIILSRSHVFRLAQAAEEMDYGRRILVVDRPGWVQQLFGFGDGTVFVPQGYDAPIVNVIIPSQRFGVSCTLEEYWAELLPIVRSQNYLLFGLAMAFLPPLLELFRSRGISTDNVIFDFCCKTSKGKTGGFIRFPGSVWGYGSVRTGFGLSWNTTSGGVDDTLWELNDCFLGLDEANNAGKTPKERADFISNAVFKIASGDPRRSKTEAYDPRSSTVVCASTSNVPLLSYVDSDADTQEAIAVRCNTILIPEERPFGVFCHLPEGFPDSAALAVKLTSLTQKFYGAPIRSFLQRLVEDRATNEDALLEQLMKYFNDFMGCLGRSQNDGPSDRKKAAFAMVYAAGRLARMWGVIPGKDDLGNLKKACLKAWSCLASQKKGPSDNSPKARLLDYVATNAAVILPVNEPQPMADKQFQSHPGFLKKGKAGIQELVLARARFESLNLSDKAIDYLKSQGILICDVDRIDAKRTVRIRPSGDDNERVIVMNLHALGVRITKGLLKAL